MLRALPRRHFSSSSGAHRVSIVYGTFGKHQDSLQDAELIHEFGQQFKAPGSRLALAGVASGVEFDFDSLRSTDHRPERSAPRVGEHCGQT